MSKELPRSDLAGSAAPASTSSPQTGSRATVVLQRRVRRWSLLLADSMAILFAIFITYKAGKLTAANLAWSLTIIPTWILVAKLYNLYDRDDRRIRHSTVEEVPQILATGAISVAIVKGLDELLPLPHIPSASMIVIGGVSVLLAYLFRASMRLLSASLSIKEQTLLVGSGSNAGMVARRLQIQAHDKIDLVGYVADSPDKSRIGPGEHDIQYRGTTDTLGQTLREGEISRVVIAQNDLSTQSLAGLIDECHRARVSVTVVPANHEVLGPGTELNRLGAIPMLDFHVSVPPRSTLVIKRLLDVLISGSLLTLASPILLVSAIMIKFDSRGPTFYRQVRVGRDGEEFRIYKLRTMVQDADKLGNRLDELAQAGGLDDATSLKSTDDPRITRVGRLLRRSSIDEIPQFLNVLKGDMSMVGPRPEIPVVVATYDERQRERLAIRPGVTGPMQIAGRGILNFEERVALERDYLDNLTITNDITILLHTPKAVIKGDGAF